MWTVIPGIFTFFINTALKCLDDSWCPSIGSEDPEDVERAETEYNKLKRNVSVSIRHSGVVKTINKN